MRRFGAVLILVTLLGLGRGVGTVRAACSDPYTVQPGDTLVSIAQQCGIANYVVLGDINPQLDDPDRLYPGQVIRLGAETLLPGLEHTGLPVEGGLQEGGVFVVRPGDTLAGICYLYNTTVAELYRYNPQLWQRAVLLPGERIQLPPDARRSKGWVGVSMLEASSGDTITMRVADFPPYTDIDFVLRLYWEQVYGPRSGDPYDTMSYAVFLDAKTDARGEAQGALVMPGYAAYTLGKPWIVEAYTSESLQRVSARSGQILICGTTYNWTTYRYEKTCTTD